MKIFGILTVVQIENFIVKSKYLNGRKSNMVCFPDELG